MKASLTTSDHWWTIEKELEKRNSSSGVYIVHGPSSDLALHATGLLERRSSRGDEVAYFLVSGNGRFRVPCYERIGDGYEERRPPAAFDVLDAMAGRSLYWQQAVYELEQTTRGHVKSPCLVFIECMTPPSLHERKFIQLMLMSTVGHRIPVILFVHQRSSLGADKEPRPESSVGNALVGLYLCGGRMRAVEWDGMTDGLLPIYGYATRRWALPRRVGSDFWVCYASRTVADLAERVFLSMDTLTVRELSKRLLMAMPAATGYPLLAVAARTGDAGAMLSRYAPRAVAASVSDLKVVTAYFRGLRHSADAIGDSSLSDVAATNEFTSLFFRSPSSPKRIFKITNEAWNGLRDKGTAARLYFELGQCLARSSDPDGWEPASICFRKSRQLTSELGSRGSGEWRSRLAAIANGEALLAVKRRQGDVARGLEALAIAELGEVGSGLELSTQRVLLEAHLGDVLLRMFNDPEAALERYSAAHAIASSCPSIEAKSYVVHRFASALIRTERYDAAVRLLHEYVAQCVAATRILPVSDPMLVLRARLTMAQAYLQAGHPRSAAACYWTALRQSEWLTPTLIRGITGNMQQCRPNMNKRLRARLTRILATQEQATGSVATARRLILSM